VIEKVRQGRIAKKIMEPEIVFIINPNSGKRGKGPIRKEKVDAFIRKRGLNAQAVLTERAGHASEIARQALEQGVERIVSLGGDGTLNEIAKVLVGTKVPLGLVPMGSGNGLARHLNLPLRFEEALEVSVGERVASIDTAEANGHPFFNVMGIGLDAEIGNRFNESKGRGFLRYLKEGWDTLFYYRSSEYTLVREGETKKVDAYLIAIANSSQYGNNGYIAPDASLKDGKFNCVVIQYPGFVGALVLIWRMFSKSIYTSKKVEAFCEESMRIKLNHPTFFHVDGEILRCRSGIDIVSRPQSLRLVLPSDDFA